MYSKYPDALKFIVNSLFVTESVGEAETALVHAGLEF